MRPSPKLLLALFSLLLSIVIGDLFCQHVFWNQLYYRPHERYVRAHPHHPELTRYQRNVHFKGEVFGDLAAISGQPEYNQYRVVRFETDDYGFRNAKEIAGPFDAVILGDSFGVGSGSSQEDIWPSQLAQLTNRKIYNLSMPGSPWQSLMNLKLEIDRIELKPGATVFFMIFSGNDLDEFYGDTMKIENLEKRGWIKRKWEGLKSGINRSYVKNRLLTESIKKRGNPSIVATTFPDGRDFLFYRPQRDRVPPDAGSAQNNKAFPSLIGVLTETVSFCESNNLKLHLIFMPTKDQVYAWLYDNARPWENTYPENGIFTALKSHESIKSIRMSDLTDDLIWQANRVYKDSAQPLWWYDDSHLNAAGHRVVAEKISQIWN